MQLTGLDHADIRVPSIAAVEAFYDAVLPALGLSRKSEAHVGADGEWYDVDERRPIVAGTPGWFVGFIEDSPMRPTATRIAFALEREDDLPAVETIVRTAGGRVIEGSIDAGYPALFFEDPVGTRLEVCARRPRT